MIAINVVWSVKRATPNHAVMENEIHLVPNSAFNQMIHVVSSSEKSLPYLSFLAI